MPRRRSASRRKSSKPRRSGRRTSGKRRSSSRAPPMRYRHRKVLRDNIHGFKNPQIKRISLKAGVGQLSGSVYDLTKRYIGVFLHELVKTAVTYAEHSRRKTITVQDILDAFERITAGHKIYGTDSSEGCKMYKGKKGKVSQATYITRQIGFYQRQHDCFYFTRTAVDRFLKEVTQDYNLNMRWTAEAKIAAQAALENYILQLFQKAGLIAHEQKRTTVMDKDLFLAARLCGAFNMNRPLEY